jgi:hypothetical protein
MTKPIDWCARVEEANKSHSLLKRKPRKFKAGFQFCPGGILNAYREGDLTFKQAVRQLEKWKGYK